VQSIGHARICMTPRCGVLDRADMAITKMQISPVIVNGFKNGRRISAMELAYFSGRSGGEKNWFREFFFKVGSTLRPCSG